MIYRRLTNNEWWRAMCLWRDGRDTLEIAREMGVHESCIYNDLGKIVQHDRALMQRAGVPV